MDLSPLMFDRDSTSPALMMVSGPQRLDPIHCKIANPLERFDGA